MRAILMLLCAWLATPAFATSGDPADICEIAAQRAARAEGVPPRVLRALTLTETGRSRNGAHRPWAWTVNMEGKGRWFDSRGEALEWVRENHARGARSYDIGCFQINYRWHGEAFDSVEAMFDPDQNASYAARFIKALHAETGSWTAAAAYYHSRTPKYANRYKERFEQILAKLDAAPVELPPVAKRPEKRKQPLGGPLIALASANASQGAIGGSLARRALAGGGGLLSAARPLFN